ncbi:hypothetical protein Pan181_19070 [Aeoliella mucimassa]|uniref:Uncharacterized protein n=2 Tax=Aeoliella mucimassa TaxID=2527972 RepID=A0A518ALX0_9BACT|nr:hypothetical protein Pan181_19070 [Aeoliella mucimassa]
MDELTEAVATLDDVQDLLDDLVVSGLRCVPATTLARLRAVADEFGTIGAEHLSQQLAQLIALVEADDREAAAQMVRLQTSLRLFERVLSLESASSSLEHFVAVQQPDDELAEEDA